MPSYFLGINIGFGSANAVALDIQGKILFSTQVFYDTLQIQAGYSEQRPDEIVKAFALCISQAVHHLNENPAAISLSAVMHSLMAIDENGYPLTNLITWADTRSSKIADKILALSEAESLYNETGTPIHAMSSLCKIIWLRENEPEIFSKTFKFISIKEYIWFKLFRQFQIDYSTASGTGLFHSEQLNWHAYSLQLAGISPDCLSIPVSPGLVRYDLQEAVANALHLEISTPFVIGAADCCLANLGSSALSKQFASIAFDSSGSVQIVSDKAINNYSSMLFNYLMEKRIFVCGGTVSNGGIVVKWCIENLIDEKLKDDFDELFRRVDAIDTGSNGLIFLPYLMGERMPVWDNNASGSFIGITLAHTGMHFLRSVIEGMCFSLNDVLQKLEQLVGYIEKVHVSGILFVSRVIIQILANVTGKSIYLMQAESTPAVGAVYLAFKALGYIETFDELPQQEISCICEPQREEHEKYKAMFKIYSQLYPKLKDTMHLLHTV